MALDGSRIICLFLATAISACASSSTRNNNQIPELARDLPQDSIENADQVFTARVKAALPDGARLSVLIDTLRDQGFEVDEEQQVAIYNQPGQPCAQLWKTQWKVKGVEIRGASGIYGLACL